LERNYFEKSYERVVEKNKELMRTEHERQVLLKYIEKLNALVKDNYTVLGIEDSKQGKVIVYMDMLDHEMDIYVENIRDKLLTLFVSYTPAENKFFIEDIQSGYYNNGFGSIAMNHLIRIAKKLKVKKITGKISNTDWDHVERLVGFYKKHGFKVTLNSEKCCGSIVWENKEI
jgi:GNAT superfamily N-acetyltransferase